MTSTQRKELNYAVAHQQAQALLKKISEMLFDMPAPDDEYFPPSWGHVEEVNEVNRKLKEVAEFLGRPNGE